MIKSLLLLFLSVAALADTPPPGTVKAKTWTGDGNTSITAHGTSLDVNVTNSSGLTTVNQGTGGVSAWKVDGSAITQPVSGTFWQTTQPVSGTFWQTTQPVSGTLTCNAGSGTQAVSLATLPALTAGAATIGAVNINGTVPVSGTFSNPANGDTGSTVPDQATQVGGVDGSGDLRALKVSNLGVLSVDASGSTVPVSGTFWQTTQPVSGTVTANAGSGTFTVDGSGHTQPVSGTFWQATQPVSAASLPLPSGASTSAKQPALGTAGTASADVLTVQGIASMTALKVDGSAVTQPVSGTFWQATQPVSGTVTANAGTGTFAISASALPLPTGAATSALQSTINTTLGSPFQAGGSIGNSSFGATQATAANLNATVVTTGGVTIAKDSSLSTINTTLGSPMQQTGGTVTANAGTGTFAVSGTFWQATQPVSIATAPALVASSAIIGKVGIDQTTPGTTNGVQVNAALPAGSNVIGHVIVDTAPTTAVTQSGTWTVNSKAATPTATTVKAAAVTIGTSAVRLTNDGLVPPSTRVLLVAQLISSSTANCFLGPSTVTSSGATRGIQMFAGQSFSFNNDAGDYYAICDATTQTFYITEQE